VSGLATVAEVEGVWRAGFQQTCYRRLLDAFSYASRVIELPEHPGDDADAAIASLATLCDEAVTIADPQGVLDERTRRFLATDFVETDQANFVIVDGTKPIPEGFAPFRGTLEEPELGATVILTVTTLGDGDCRLDCSGPGIDGNNEVAIAGLDKSWLRARADWCAVLPVGVDLLLADKVRVCAFPRSTRIEEVH
jgi:alpha-D-ribose 1-methylphosphonate 5-triphosphate synthase subunit PhnH